MKNIFGFLLALVVMSGAYAKSVTVGVVADGDTFVTANDEIPVSIINVDAPELGGKCESEKELAIKARERLMELLPEGTVVELKDVEEVGNHHKKIKAKVILSDGRDVGEILIKENLGRAFKRGHRNKSWCK